MQAKGDGPLFVPLAVYNGVPFPDMEQGQGEGHHFVTAETAVQHQGADTEVAKLEQRPGVKASQQSPDFGIRQGVYLLALGLWEPELFRKVLRDVFLPVTPSQEGAQGPDVRLEGDRGKPLFPQGKVVFPQPGQREVIQGKALSQEGRRP